MAKKGTESKIPEVDKTLVIKYHIANLNDKYTMYEIINALIPNHKHKRNEWINAFKKIISETS